MSVQPLVGRERELSEIEQLLDRVGEGGGSLLVQGEAGIGKTALLDAAESIAVSCGLTVLRAAGVPSEMEMPYAGLHQLLRSHLGRIDDLPGPQRQALSSAFGLRNGAAPDRFLVALAALELLAETAAATPVLLIVDDAHWLDVDTAEVIAFVARRVEVEPIVVLFAVRTGLGAQLEAARLPELHVKGLGENDSASLLEEHAPGCLARDARRRLLDAAGGNPLALMELPRASAADAADNAVVPAPLPLTERLERAFSERLSGLPRATCDLLLIAALGEGGRLTEQLTAAGVVAGRPLAPADLSPAESAGLVTVDAGAVRFRHPLVRAAVHSTEPTAARQAGHAALADAYAQDLERSVWHRAASRSGPDDDVASELEQAAARSLRRGAPAVAAAALERSAQLASTPSRRGGLLVQAAEIEFELGRPERALALLAEAKPLDLGSENRARLMFVLESADEVSWAGAERVAAFAEIADRMTAAADPERALKSLQAAALRCWWGNPAQETRDLVVAAAERIPVDPNDAALLAVLAFADPVGRGAVVNERISSMSSNPGADPAATHLVGTAATAVWSFDVSLDFLTDSVDGLRAEGRLGLLAQALVSQGWAALHLAKGSLALSASEEAVRLAMETGQPRWALGAQLALATLAGERGDIGTAEALAGEAEAILLPMGVQPMLALVQFSRGRFAVAHQRYGDGLEHLKRILDPSDVAYHPFVGAWALSDLVEAAALSGQTEAAGTYLRELESLTSLTHGSFLRATLAYARPFLAGDGDAESLYEVALTSDLVNWPCYRGRLLLNYGRWLRRQRRVAESRAPLRAARENFDALAFRSLADCARQELRASGETSMRPTPDARDRLTPQELQIAGMAAGLTNREIGQKLYLSHRTVESHLYRIFPKLEITGRAQLITALPEAAAEHV